MRVLNDFLLKEMFINAWNPIELNYCYQLYTRLVGPLIRAAYNDYCWDRKMKEPLAGQMVSRLETAFTSPDHGRLKPEQAI